MFLYKVRYLVNKIYSNQRYSAIIFLNCDEQTSEQKLVF